METEEENETHRNLSYEQVENTSIDGWRSIEV